MTTEQRAADVDHLTGLPMGERLDALTAASWDSATALSAAMAVVLVELDDFECYGDRYGTEAAETLLRRTAAVIRGSGLKAGEQAGRVAGAEFLLLLPGASLDAAQIPAERILRGIRALEIPNRGSTVANVVTVSIGAASCRPQPGDALATLVDAGASALWTAKRRGRNRIAGYELSPGGAAEELPGVRRHAS